MMKGDSNNDLCDYHSDIDYCCRFFGCKAVSYKKAAEENCRADEITGRQLAFCGVCG